MNKAASALGKLARGIPKNFTPAELARRTALLAAVNRRRKAANKKRTL
jgi:hypothetical protein